MFFMTSNLGYNSSATTMVRIRDPNQNVRLYGLIVEISDNQYELLPEKWIQKEGIVEPYYMVGRGDTSKSCQEDFINKVESIESNYEWIETPE